MNGYSSFKLSVFFMFFRFTELFLFDYVN